jgi:hypothetical protein
LPTIKKKSKNEKKMTVTEEFTETLFSNETIEKVKAQFISGTEIISVDKYDMNFRLLLVGETINLELFGSGSFGHYFKPIGFYDKNLNIYILREFENDFESLVEKGEVSNIFSAKKLSLEQNAVIGAFSMETLIQAQQLKDSSFLSNGLNFDIFITLDGDPQVFLDDKYNISDPIAIYFLKTQNKSINPTVVFKELFDENNRKQLLSAFKTI